MATLAQRLCNASESGVYRVSSLQAVSGEARSAGLDVAHISLAGVRGKERLLETIAAALAFPRWFGGNWDALEDALSDLAWRPASGYLLLFEGQAELGDDDLGVLLDVLAAAAEFWAGEGRPFFAAFMPAPAGRTLAELA